MTTPASDKAAPLTALGERALAALIRERFPSAPSLLTVGIGDDAAIAVPVRGGLDVLTTDALVEGVHFDLTFSSFADVGYKALAVNASDIAAMGAAPRLALLSLMLPAHVTLGDVEQLLDGVARMAREAKITLAGGNLTRSPGPLIVDVALTGSVRPRRFLTRSGGRPGDGLYVTGMVGGAAAGLGWLRAHASSARVQPDPGLAECIARYRTPEPRTRFGSLLGRTRSASACMDLSDGLADAVHQLAAASGTGALVDAACLPIPAAASAWFSGRGDDPVRASVAGGDDYELLFSLPDKHRGRLKTVLRQARGVPATRIGELTASPAVVLRRGEADEPMPDGFAHF